MPCRLQDFEPSRSRPTHAQRTEHHEDVREDAHSESDDTFHYGCPDHAEDRGNLLYEEYAPTN